MPQAQPSHPPEFGDAVEADELDPIHPGDGFAEIASTQGYGRLVVTVADAAEHIATGRWVAYP